MGKASTIVGLLVAVAAIICTILFFVATQEISGRDIAVVILGCVVGGTLAGSVATFIFHADRRKVSVDLADRETQSRIDNERAKAQAEAEVIRAQAQKKLELLAALPTRLERIRELRAELAELSREIIAAQTNADSLQYSAKESAEYGFGDISLTSRGEAAIYQSLVGEKIENTVSLNSELAHITAMSDEEYLLETKRLRGLN